MENLKKLNPVNAYPKNFNLIKISYKSKEAQTLLEQCFGGQRLSRGVYSLRKNNEVKELSLAVQDALSKKLIGCIFYWQILLGNASNIALLGPLAIAPKFRNQGYGKILIKESIQKATTLKLGAIIVSGDTSYYQPYGFVSLGDRITLPNNGKPSQGLSLMGLEIIKEYLANKSGELAAFV